jgi:hypothetical protein
MSGPVTADIVYYHPPAPLPPEARPDFESLPLAPDRMTVQDMRDRPGAFSLDVQGFELVSAPTAMRDFHDPEEVKQVYWAEAGELVKRVTGCADVKVSTGGVVRVSRRASVRPAGATHTGDFVHADYSHTSGGEWLRRIMPPEEAELRSATASSTCGAPSRRRRRIILWPCATPARCRPPTSSSAPSP